METYKLLITNVRNLVQFCICYSYLRYSGVPNRQAALGYAVWSEFTQFARVVAAFESAEQAAQAMIRVSF